MKKLIFTLITILAVSLLFSGTIFAQKRNNQKGLMKEQILDKLELSDEQMEEIDILRDEHQLKAIDLHAELQKNRIEMKNLMDADNIEENSVMNIVEKNNSIHNKLEVMRAEMLLKMRSVLTPEQREKAKGLHMFGDGFGRGNGLGMRQGFKHDRNSKPGFGRNDDARCRFR